LRNLGSIPDLVVRTVSLENTYCNAFAVLGHTASRTGATHWLSLT